MASANCANCAPATVMNLSGCNFAEKKGGFRHLFAVHCGIDLYSPATQVNFLNNLAVAVTNPPGVTPTITIAAALAQNLMGSFGESVIGSIAKGETTKLKKKSCLPEQRIGDTWNFKFDFMDFDLSGLYTDDDFWEEFLNAPQNYHLIAVPCSANGLNEAHVLVKGEWSLSDFDFTHPADGVKEFQMRTFTAQTPLLKSPPRPQAFPVLPFLVF